MPLDLVQTLSELVAIPSVNPMGQNVSGPEYFEYRVTEYLETLFDQLGLPHQRQFVDEKRENIVARLEGGTPPEEGGELILFEAHQDTVPVEGMTIDPWKPQLREGKLFGRGACDIKGGMTAMLSAISRLSETSPEGRPTIIMACTVNEEHGFSGALELTRLWEPGVRSLIPRRPDMAIVAEPTGLNVVVAHKGTIRWRCRVHGKAAHSSQPRLGENAIYKMAHALHSLEAYQHEAAATLGNHPLCGQATLSVGMIHGGLSVNTVPDLCTIEIDRRLLPGEDALTAYGKVLKFMAEYPGVDFELDHEMPYLIGAALSDEANGSLADRLAEDVQQLVGQVHKIGVPYGTDAATFAEDGIPTVVFGPGSIDQAHTADEWIALDELQRASEILYRFGRGSG